MARNPFRRWAAEEYRDHHYRQVRPEDSHLGNWTVSTLRDSRIRRDYATAVEIGNAGILRSIAFVGGNLAADARVTLTDVGPQQRRAARRELRDVRKGRPSVWHAHLADVVQGNPDINEGEPHPWMEGALGAVAARAAVRRHDISKKPLGRAGMRVACFVLDSWTDDPIKFQHGLDNFYAGMEPGDTAVLQFDVEGKGYKVGGREYKNYPTTEETFRADAEKRNLVVVGSTTVPVEDFSGQKTGSTFTAIGGMVVLMP